MYSPKRSLRLFRDPEFTVADRNQYSYTWTQRPAWPIVIATTISIDDTGLTGILATSSQTDGTEGPYVTRDGGTTWTRQTTGISFPTSASTVTCVVARSAPNIMYCANSGGTGDRYVYKSTDYGSTWTDISSIGSRPWNTVVCSSTGRLVLVVDTSSGVAFRSTNEGSTWSNISPLANVPWGACCMSENGQVILLGVTNGGALRRSINGGSSFTAVGPTGFWRGLSCSADGSVIFGASANAAVNCVISRDSGATWTSNVNPSGSATDLTGYRKTACSLNGTKLAVTDGFTTAPGGYIWVSQDRGSNWAQQAIANRSAWQGLAMTANGRILLAGTADASRGFVGIGV